MKDDRMILVSSCSAPVFACRLDRPRYVYRAYLMRLSLVAMVILIMLHILSFSSKCFAEQAYTAEEQALIDLLRLPSVPVKAQWSYDPAYFDALRWGALDEKILKRKQLLAMLDPAKKPEACADLLREIAVLLLQQNKEKDAEDYARRAVSLYQGLVEKEPKPARLLYRLGLAQRIVTGGTGTSSAERAAFEASIKADPDYCPPYLDLMIMTAGAKPWIDLAGQCVAKAVAREPKKAELYYNRHRYEFNAYLLDMLNLQTAIQTASAENSLVKLLSRMTSDQNINSLGKAVQLEPENVTYRASLAGLQSLRIYVEWAGQQEALMQTGQSGEEAFRRASAMTRDKNKDRSVEAEEHFQHVEKKMKDTFPALYMLWSILPMADGNMNKAEQSMHRAIVLDPQEGSYYQTLLYMVVNDGLPGQQAKLKQVADLMDKKCPVKCTADERRIIARIRFSEKNYREAEKQLRAALIEDPASFPIRTGLAVTLFKMHRIEEGLAELRAAQPFVAKADDADVAHFYSLTALLSMLEGDVETAKQRVQKALTLNPNDPVANALVKK